MDPERTLPATEASSSITGPHRPASEIPRTLGRYTVLDRLGAGATGVVFTAYDPQLDRRVAVKLLKYEGGDKARESLLAEARALGKLAHPNVVAVHDVGEVDNRAFIAMAFVDGSTLRDWSEDKDVGTRIDALVGAARGIAAAHAAGLVHRDVKPDNIIIDHAEQRPRVADFGLAQKRHTDTQDPNVDLTERRTLGLVGTPAYMAPEVLEGKAADERSDQFSFCVTAWEILYGSRPFGDSVGAIVLAQERAEPLKAPADSTVPKWIHSGLLRGLSIDPDARWPDMPALVAALTADPSAGRRSVARLASTGVFVALVTTGVVMALGSSEPCQDGAAQLDSAWSDTHRQQVQQGIDAVDAPFAAATGARVLGRLDGYATDWLSAYEDACTAHTRGEQSGELLDLRMACLNRSRDELGTFASSLRDADVAALEHADDAVGALSPIRLCNDVEGLRQRAPLPKDVKVRQELAAIEASLAQVRTASRLRRGDGAIEDVRGLVERSVATGYLPTVARAELQLGLMHLATRESDESRAALERAWHVALRADEPVVATRAAIASVGVLGFDNHSRAAADMRAGDARVFIQRIAQTDPASAVDFEMDLAVEEAKAALRSPDRSEADGIARRAIDRLRADAPDDLRIPALVGIRGWVAQGDKDFEGALVYYEDALATVERVYGADHPSTATVHNNVGLVLKNLERFDEATKHLRRAVQIVEPFAPDDDPRLFMYLRNLGNAHLAAGDDEAAIEFLDRAYATATPDEPALWTLQFQYLQYTRALRRLGHTEAAATRRAHLRTTAVAENLTDKHVRFVAETIAAEGKQSDAAWAIELGEQVLEALRARGAPPGQRGTVALALAGALLERRDEGDPARARRLLDDAITGFEAAGGDGDPERAKQVDRLRAMLER